MTYLIDTDHFSILHRQQGPDYENLAQRMSDVDDKDFAVSIVTFQEQALGAHALLQRAKNRQSILSGFRLLQAAFVDFQRFLVLPIEDSTLAIVENLGGSIRVGANDLRIAATAIQNDLTLLTRNSKDFEKIPGLKFEDWTADEI